MSRKTLELQKDTDVHYGGDHAIGTFIDITDRRYANSGKDEQGEGYIVEWSEKFGFNTNLIGITAEELRNSSDTIRLVNKFIGKL